VVVGTVDLNRSIALGRSSSAFEVFLVDAEGRIVSHVDARRAASRERLGWLPPLGPGSLAMVKETERDGKPMISGIANVGVGGLRAGAEIPKSVAYFALRSLLLNLIFLSLGLLIVAAVVSLIWATQMTRSLSQLTRAAQAVGQGDFDVQVAVPSRDEMGQLAGSFNQMASELHGRDQALKEAQAQLIQSEKMAAFGQLGAGIAHEVKNPLQTIVLGIDYLTNYGAFQDENAKMLLEHMTIGVRRCDAIIHGLMEFSSYNKKDVRAQSLSAILDQALRAHEVDFAQRRLRVLEEFAKDLPLLRLDSRSIKHVFINLIAQAAQGLPPGSRPGLPILPIDNQPLSLPTAASIAGGQRALSGVFRITVF